MSNKNQPTKKQITEKKKKRNTKAKKIIQHLQKAKGRLKRHECEIYIYIYIV